MKYGRVENNLVVEVFNEPDGFTINQCFHPDMVALFQPIPDEVEQNWIKNEDGSFSKPE